MTLRSSDPAGAGIDDVEFDAGVQARRAGMLVWGQIAAKATAFAVPLIIVRLVGQAEVGVFVTLILVYETVALVLAAGFPQAILYYYAGRGPADRRLVAVRMIRTLIAAGLIGAGAIALLATVATGDSSTAFLAGVDGGPLALLGLYALFDLPARLIPNMLLGEGRARAAAGAELVKALGGAAAAVVPLALGAGIGGVASAFVVFGAVQGIALAAIVIALYRGTGPASDAPTTRAIVAYALPLGATEVINQLNRRVDVWLIVVFFATTDVAVYQAGALEIPVITTVAYSVGSVFLARYATLHRAGRFRDGIDLWRQTITKVALIVVPAAAVFFVGAEEFVAVAFPDGYGGAANVFRAYTLLTMARVTAFGAFMIAAGRPGFVLQSSLFTIASNVAISVPLVLWLGIAGAAIGTVAAFVPTVVIYCAYIARAWNVPLRSTFPLVAYTRVVATAVVPVVLGFGAKAVFTVDPGVELAVVAVVVVGAFGALGTAVGLIGRDEWRFLGDWLRFRGQ